MNLDEQDTAGRVDALAVLGLLATSELIAPPPPHVVERTIHCGVGLVDWTSRCAAVPHALLAARFAESVERPEEFFTDESLNLFLSLFCGSPNPPYEFFVPARRDEALLAWAAWRILFELAHAAFRSRARHLLAGTDVELLPHRSEIVEGVATLIPMAWRPATAFYQAACDFAFWGKEAAPEARVAHGSVVSALRENGYLDAAA